MRIFSTGIGAPIPNDEAVESRHRDSKQIATGILQNLSQYADKVFVRVPQQVAKQVLFIQKILVKATSWDVGRADNLIDGSIGKAGV